MTLGCLLLLLTSGAIIFQENTEERQVAEGKELLENKNSGEALKILEDVVEKSPKNQQAEQLLMEAEKSYLIQQIKHVDQAYKKADYKTVEELSEKILKNYSNDPTIGFLTEKVVYIQQKSLQNRILQSTAK